MLSNIVPTAQQPARAALVGDVPLRVKSELVPALLADCEFRQVPTQELLELARLRKRIYVVDRASAIAVLKGTR